jgi:hypothetical protein
MANHPNRRKRSTNRLDPAANPSQAQIRKAREQAGHTMREAAATVYATLHAWQNWETDPMNEYHRRMHPALFELYLLKTGQMELKDLSAAPF